MIPMAMPQLPRDGCWRACNWLVRVKRDQRLCRNRTFQYAPKVEQSLLNWIQSSAPCIISAAEKPPGQSIAISKLSRDCETLNDIYRRSRKMPKMMPEILKRRRERFQFPHSSYKNEKARSARGRCELVSLYSFGDVAKLQLCSGCLTGSFLEDKQ